MTLEVKTKSKLDVLNCVYVDPKRTLSNNKMNTSAFKSSRKIKNEVKDVKHFLLTHLKDLGDHFNRARVEK